jgi:PAS domain S-box-containing protein
VGYALLAGLLFGGATILGMVTPVIHQPGLIFDGRSIVLGIAGFFGGPLVALVSAAIAAGFRLSLGGSGAPMGVLVILESALLGAAGFIARRRWAAAARPLPLLLLGLAIHGIMVALMPTLPGDASTEVLRRLGPVVLLGFPLAFMLTGLGFLELERHFDTQKALRESEEKFALTFLHNPVPMTLSEVETGLILDANEAWARFSGVPREELVGRTSAELGLLTVEERRDLRGGLEARGFLRDQPVAIRTQDGRLHQTLLGVELLTIGGRRRLLSSVLDITEQRNAEDASREAASLLRTLIDTLPDLVWLKDPQGIYLSCNKRFERFFGQPEAVIVGRTDHDFLQADQADFFRRNDQAVATAGRALTNEEWITFKDDGHREFLETIKTPIHGKDGEFLGVLGIGRDITERVKAMEAVQEKEAEFRRRFEKISDQVPGVVFQLRKRPDGSTQVPFASQAIQYIYGLAPGDLREDTAPMRALHHPEDRPAIADALHASAQALAPCRMEYRLRFPDGDVRNLYFDAVPEREEDGSVLWTGCITDLTDRKRTEAQLQQAQKMESLGSLAGGVAHDMNNVLGAILALASAHLVTQEEGQPVHKAFSTIRDAALRGGGMVRSLLNFARSTPKERRMVAFNDLLLEDARLLEHTTLAKVHLELDLAPDLRAMHGDAGELSRAIMNLCINAVDAMDGGGTLTLRTRNLEGDSIEVEVLDTGSGMPPEVLRKALDPFFTTKEVGKGTGLGLSMVYSTVKAHQGQLLLHSEPGRGTQVRLQFPAQAAGGVAGGQEPPPAMRAADTALKVLLVDDDGLIQESTRTVLEVLGHAVTVAASGEEALERVQEEGFKPDILILDMNMPGLGGKGTLPRFRSLHPTVPVLLATGRADQDALDLIAAFPGVTLFPKPFTIQELQNHLVSVARQR